MAECRKVDQAILASFNCSNLEYNGPVFDPRLKQNTERSFETS
jgi:hypothetical protein